MLPKSPLWHLLMSRASPTGWGDLVFGWLLFLVASVVSATLFLGSGIVYASAAFFLGHADALATQAENAIIHMATYPGSIFEGLTRLIIYTVIPAGFMNSMPVAVVRGANLGNLTLACLAAAAWLLGGQALFSRGLRRYESGSLLGPRT